MVKRRITWIHEHPLLFFAAVSLLWVALLYGRAFNGPFIYDDTLAIQNNSNLESWQGVAQYFSTAVPLSEEYRGFAGSVYRPVYWLTLFFDRSLWGLNPAGFHFTNLALHWLNGLLAFLLLRRLGVRLIVGAATCLIWLGLPILTEVVAWISGRPASLVMFFLLLSALSSLAYLERPNLWLLTSSALSCAAALLSNESGLIVLPLMLLVARASACRAEIRLGLSGFWPLFTLTVANSAAIAICLFSRHLAGAELPTGQPALWALGPSLAKYLQWIFLPLGMSMERSTDTPANVASPSSIAALVLLLGLCSAVVMLRKRMPHVAAGLAWLLIAIAPFCGLVYLYQGMAERYTYVASLGLVFAIISAAFRAPKRWQLVTGCFLAAWVLWGAWRLNTRVGDWLDETRLYQSSLAATPQSAVLLYDLGVGAAEAGNLDGAADYYRHALTENPKYASALINLGSVLHRQGKDAEAIATLTQAIAMAPRSPEPWVNLGNIYLGQGLKDEAKQAYAKALSLDQSNVEALVNLGAVLQSSGDLKAAEEQYRRAIQANPRKAAAYCDLGSVLLREGKTAAALNAFNQAITAEPGYAKSYVDLGIVYESLGRRELAVQMYTKALELQPGDDNARARLERLK